MAYSDSFPATRPVFQSDFANGGRIDPRISYSRSTTGTYFGTDKHESSQNLITNSEDFSAWTAVNTSPTANAVASPDGTTTADTITGTGTGSIARRVQSNTLNNVSYPVVSVYVKAGTHNYIQVMSNWSGSHYANFDVTSGAGAVGSLGGNTTATIQAIGSTGWYRCVCRFNVASMSAEIFVSLVDSTSAGHAPTTTSTGTVHLWGAMANTQGDLTNIVKYQPSTTQIHREYAPTLQTAAINAPRFEHSASDSASEVMGESLGLLVEGQSQNLFAYSDDFANNWTITGNVNVSESAGISPTGGLNADLIYADDTAADSHYLFSSCTVSAAAHTFSVYAKYAGVQYIQLQHRVTGVGIGQFDLVNGTFVVSGATGAMEPVGNGWYRCSVTETQSAGTAFGRIWLMGGSGVSDYNWDGDSYSGVLLYGAQYEANSFPSSLIACNGSATTRAADSASVVDSSLFDNGSGAVFVETGSVSTTNYPTPLTISDQTSSNLVRLQGNSTGTNMEFQCKADNSLIVQVSTPFTASGTKLAASYNTNAFSFCADGGTVVSDSSGQLPEGLEKLHIGTDWNGSNTITGHIRRIAVYPALSDTNLQALTS